MSRIYGTGILKSIGIAFKNFFRPPITLQYPHEKMELPERSRGAVYAVVDEEGNPKCRACLACVRACPDFVLQMEITTDPETKTKHIDDFHYEVAACMFCRLCVETCPFDALEMSNDYELARTSGESLRYSLLRDVPAAVPPRREPAERPAKKDAPSSSTSESPAASEKPATAEAPEASESSAPAQEENEEANSDA
jgi:NADH-quinone oxidoreductase subunit I